MDNKETRTARLELRLTPTEKEMFKEYAESRGLSMCEAVRLLCNEVFQ